MRSITLYVMDHGYDDSLWFLTLRDIQTNSGQLDLKWININNKTWLSSFLSYDGFQNFMIQVIMHLIHIFLFLLMCLNGV